jgi:23S rRNA (uracil1939-C5)-methyltransferase
VRDFLKQNQEFFDFILIDPPRTGVEKEVLESLLKLAPFEICYVSCDPATLARDLRRLSAKYKITSVKAIDMFPQTHHIETVVRLRKI